MNLTFEEFVDRGEYKYIEDFYKDLPLIPGAKEAIEKLERSGKYYLCFVSAPSWKNVNSFSDKRIWIEKHFPNFKKRMDLSFHKGYYMGHYLIDDRIKYGAEDFIGEHIMFGDRNYSNWDDVLNKLL